MIVSKLHFRRSHGLLARVTFTYRCKSNQKPRSQSKTVLSKLLLKNISSLRDSLWSVTLLSHLLAGDSSLGWSSPRSLFISTFANEFLIDGDWLQGSEPRVT